MIIILGATTFKLGDMPHTPQYHTYTSRQSFHLPPLNHWTDEEGVDSICVDNAIIFCYVIATIMYIRRAELPFEPRLHPHISSEGHQTLELLLINRRLLLIYRIPIYKSDSYLYIKLLLIISDFYL